MKRRNVLTVLAGLPFLGVWTTKSVGKNVTLTPIIPPNNNSTTTPLVKPKFVTCSNGHLIWVIDSIQDMEWVLWLINEDISAQLEPCNHCGASWYNCSAPPHPGYKIRLFVHTDKGWLEQGSLRRFFGRRDRNDAL